MLSDGVPTSDSSAKCQPTSQRESWTPVSSEYLSGRYVSVLLYIYFTIFLGQTMIVYFCAPHNFCT